MQINIARWGNSLALRLPSHIAREGRLEEGATVNVEVRQDGALVITALRKKVSLAELLEKVPAGATSGEVDWGDPAGREAW